MIKIKYIFIYQVFKGKFVKYKMLWIFVPLFLYCIPLYSLPNATENLLYKDHFYPLLTIIFCIILLSGYYCLFIQKYKQYNLIHKKIFFILMLSIISKFLVCINIPNVIIVQNKPIYLFRWSEWFSTIYLMMDIVVDTMEDHDKHRYLYQLNILAQVLCIFFGYISLFRFFWFFSILSTIVHLFIFYVLYKTKNIFLGLFEGVSLILIVYYFMYFTNFMNELNYHLSIWICELLIKGLFVVLTTMNFMLKRDFIIEEYIHREKVFYIIHDLRIHLNSIRLGLSQLEQNDITRLMKVSLNAMIDLINQILFFNKIFKDELVLSKDFFSVKSLITQVIDEFSFQFVQKNIEYKLDISDDFNIYADRKGLKTVFLNLISNAIKYTKDIIYIRIQFYVGKNDDIRMKFSVLDNGKGISPSFIPKLFQPFSQTESSDNSSGLGLYLSKKIIEAHNGTINYKYENGAMFYGHLDTIYKTSQSSETDLSSEILRLRPFTHKSIKKILITDDSNLNRSLLVKVLRSIKNFEILEASNGKEAIEIIKHNHDIDLIFMDFHMPHMSGKDTIDKIKAMGYDKNIILLTGLMKEELFKTFDIEYIIIKPIYKSAIIDLFKSENIL